MLTNRLTTIPQKFQHELARTATCKNCKIDNFYSCMFNFILKKFVKFGDAFVYSSEHALQLFGSYHCHLVLNRFILYIFSFGHVFYLYMLSFCTCSNLVYVFFFYMFSSCACFSFAHAFYVLKSDKIQKNVLTHEHQF